MRAITLTPRSGRASTGWLVAGRVITVRPLAAGLPGPLPGVASALVK